MVETLRELGHVKLTQVQPVGLITETSSGSTYDASRRVEVSRLLITPQGIEATTPDGERALDIHHTAHPRDTLPGRRRCLHRLHITLWRDALPFWGAFGGWHRGRKRHRRM